MNGRQDDSNRDKLPARGRRQADSNAVISGGTGARFAKCRPTTLTRADFLDAFGRVYEHSTWIAERVFDGGLSAEHDTVEGLHAAMVSVVAAADREAQLALLRAHPDLAGKLAMAGELTEASQSEQAGSGLSACSPEEFRRFQELNERYKAKFGFPFILAVRGRQRAEILEAFEVRAGNSPEQEFEAALEQVHRIALLRLSEFA